MDFYEKFFTVHLLHQENENVMGQSCWNYIKVEKFVSTVFDINTLSNSNRRIFVKVLKNHST